MTTIKIECRQVSFRFRDNSAFCLNIDNYRAELNGASGLYGLSGSGKTSFSKLLAGLLTPQHGKIVCEFDPPTTRIPRVIYAPQFPEKVFLGVGVQETVGRICRQKKEGCEVRAALYRYLEIFALDYDLIRRKSGHELSGGELRRFALSLTFALAPDLLILDEPTIGLGDRGKAELVMAIKQFQREHLVMLVSHEFAIIRRICRQGSILHKGALIFHGTWRELDQKRGLQKRVGIDKFELLERPELLKHYLRHGEPSIEKQSSSKIRIDSSG